MVTPSVAEFTPLVPVGTYPEPQLVPASGMYGRFVKVSGCPLTVVSVCQAQYCVPKPDGVTPCGEATTICTLVPLTPKWVAARCASVVSWACEARAGDLTPLSTQVPASGLEAGWPACVPAVPQIVLPTATPEQYCVVDVDQLSPAP